MQQLHMTQPSAGGPAPCKGFPSTAAAGENALNGLVGLNLLPLGSLLIPPELARAFGLPGFQIPLQSMQPVPDAQQAPAVPRQPLAAAPLAGTGALPSLYPQLEISSGAPSSATANGLHQPTQQPPLTSQAPPTTAGATAGMMSNQGAMQSAAALSAQAQLLASAGYMPLPGMSPYGGQVPFAPYPPYSMMGPYGMDPYMNHMYRTSNMGMGALPGGQPGGPQGGSMGNVQQPAATHATDTTEEDGDADGAARAIKRPRLVWTAQLHKRFEEAIQKLGENRAVPKSIMQEMNVEGLTRENVASHLQKWRLQNKRWEPPREDGLVMMAAPAPAGLPADSSPPNNGTKPHARAGKDATAAAGGRIITSTAGVSAAGGDGGDEEAPQEEAAEEDAV